jgi:hypothetical protein
MLAIIKQGKQGKSNLNLVTNRRHVSQTKFDEEEVPLLRAPGISSAQPESILRPIARAATMPAQLGEHESVDFEPFEGPSLFTNFRTTMTTEENIQRWEHDRHSTMGSLMGFRKQLVYQSTPVCGTNVKEAKHAYMTSGYIRPDTIRNSLRESDLPSCKQCIILCETLERLRQNLSLSSPSSPNPKVELDVTSMTPKQELPYRRSDTPKTEQRVDQSSKRESKLDQVPWQDGHQCAAETHRLTARRHRFTSRADLEDLKDVVKDTASNQPCQVQQSSTDFEAGPSKSVSSLNANRKKNLAAYQEHLQIQEEQSRRRLVSRDQDARPEQSFSLPSLPQAAKNTTLAAFQRRLEILEEQTRRRLALRDSEMHMEKEEASPAQPFPTPEAERQRDLAQYRTHLEISDAQNEARQRLHNEMQMELLKRPRLEPLSGLVKQADGKARPTTHTEAIRIPKKKEYIQAKQAYDQARAARDLEAKRLVHHHDQRHLSTQEDHST